MTQLGKRELLGNTTGGRENARKGETLGGVTIDPFTQGIQCLPIANYHALAKCRKRVHRPHEKNGQGIVRKNEDGPTATDKRTKEKATGCLVLGGEIGGKNKKGNKGNLEVGLHDRTPETRPTTLEYERTIFLESTERGQK